MTAPTSTPADPFDLYANGLGGGALYLRHADGRLVPVPTRRWTSGLGPGDDALLDRCVGRTLDVGCGPGRLSAALRRRGRQVLGIDVSGAALALARSVGAPVLACDVFGAVPGRWFTVLLADGNIGIGGDPVRLLRRCRSLLSPDGRVVVELLAVPARVAAPMSWSSARSRAVRLEDGAGTVSDWFPWALPSSEELRLAAQAAGLRPIEEWSAAGRAFVAFARAT